MERLDKLLAGQGLSSRSEIKKQITSGTVTVGGKVIKKTDHKVDPNSDIVRVDGIIQSLKPYLYIMMNKPTGVVSATRDPKEKTVIDLVPDTLRRKNLFPAGRLDKDTTGLMLITDDGALAHRILAPKSHIPKVYLATLDRLPDEAVAKGFAQGLMLSGERCLPARMELLTTDPIVARVTLREGMYHQIKRMFLSFGITVTALKRIQMGQLGLDESLAAGQCRELTAEEKVLLELDEKGQI